MPTFIADLHIHTVLSPCGDLEMSPTNIVRAAKAKNLDIIGITDHNSTLHCKLVREIAKEQNIFVLCGAEVTTKEEVHCLTYFPTDAELNDFQQYLEQHLPPIKNNVSLFGYQVVVDRDENIIQEIDNLLISALDVSIDQLEQKVHSLNGIFIPAHIDKSKFSLISQLGFVPKDLKVEALELSSHTTKDDFLKSNKYLRNYTFIQNSDAHYINDIGKTFTSFEMNEISFSEIKNTLNFSPK